MTTLKAPSKKPFENIEGKQENAGNQHLSKMFAVLRKINLATVPAVLSLGSVHKTPYIENTYIALPYIKISKILGEMIIFEPWREKYHFSQPS